MMQGEDEEDRYLARLEAGLATAQSVALVAGQLWSIGHSGLRGRIRKGLAMQVRRDGCAAAGGAVTEWRIHGYE